MFILLKSSKNFLVHFTTPEFGIFSETSMFFGPICFAKILPRNGEIQEKFCQYEQYSSFWVEKYPGTYYLKHRAVFLLMERENADSQNWQQLLSTRGRHNFSKSMVDFFCERIANSINGAIVFGINQPFTLFWFFSTVQFLLQSNCKRLNLLKISQSEKSACKHTGRYILAIKRYIVYT